MSVINYQKSANNSLGAIFGNIESSDELAVAGEGLGLSIKDGQYAYVVTNTHVINNAEKIDILLASGEKSAVNSLVPIPILI